VWTTAGARGAGGGSVAAGPRRGRVSGRLAVTGANGFLGRHLTRAAAAAGWEVVGVVRSEAAAELVREAGGSAAVTHGLEPGALAPALTGCRAVVHLAQIGAERDGATYEAVNVGGTRSVVAAARAAAVPRVVLLSGLGVARYGVTPRCTNPYFLSKLASEVELFRSGREAVVFRPSYIVGPGDALVGSLSAELARGEVEQPGDGSFRLQPVFVGDAAAAILAGATAERLEEGRRVPAVYDLVGPEPVTYRDLVERLARVSPGARPPRIRPVPVEEVDRRASAEGGYRGMLPDEVDCLLCDEVSDPGPLEALLGRPLTPVAAALAAAVRAPA
jgi:nucleoside-diphosphate-sugar epimerase